MGGYEIVCLTDDMKKYAGLHKEEGVFNISEYLEKEYGNKLSEYAIAQIKEIIR